MNANEGVCVRLNVIHTTSNWACKEVQNWGWQPPKPKQPGRMSDITCAEDTLHAWFRAVGGKKKKSMQPILTTALLPEKLPYGKLLMIYGNVFYFKSLTKIRCIKRNPQESHLSAGINRKRLTEVRLFFPLLCKKAGTDLRNSNEKS